MTTETTTVERTIAREDLRRGRLYEVRVGAVVRKMWLLAWESPWVVLMQYDGDAASKARSVSVLKILREATHESVDTR